MANYRRRPDISMCSHHEDMQDVLCIMGTPEQIELIIKICGSLQRGTLIQDILRLLGDVQLSSRAPHLPVREGGAFGQPWDTPKPLPPTPAANQARSTSTDEGSGEGVRSDG